MINVLPTLVVYLCDQNMLHEEILKLWRFMCLMLYRETSMHFSPFHILSEIRTGNEEALGTYKAVPIYQWKFRNTNDRAGEETLAGCMTRGVLFINLFGLMSVE